ncbi:hypothetical protein [Pseudooctadecabacter sp.]|uniref:hypothetical protein n=1 Tax=Pseudooctadecabacter sp. TaxID=1966338 RepID=UPI0025F400EC|nr:hypothetical protein [Pseudooctadecabacter sp.]
MKHLIFGLGLLAAGCAETTSSGGSFAAGAQPAGAQQAYFEGYPAGLFFAAGAVCDGPGQDVVRPDENEVRCESLPDPQTAAALILQFDGTVEDLPRFVIAFSGLQDTAGYLVTADSYIRVPRREGGAQQVRFPDERIEAELARLLVDAGGAPL